MCKDNFQSKTYLSLRLRSLSLSWQLCLFRCTQREWELAGTRKREGWREVLYKQPFVCPDFCLWLTALFSSEGPEDGLLELSLSVTANLDQGRKNERIFSSRKWLVHPGFSEENNLREQSITSSMEEEETRRGITLSCCRAWAGCGEWEGVSRQCCTGRRTWLLDRCLILLCRGRTDLTKNFLQSFNSWFWDSSIFF